MVFNSSMTSSKSLSNIKTPFLFAALAAVSLNYGIRCYYIENSNNTLLILLFFLSLLAFWRCLTVDKVEKNEIDGTVEIKLKGNWLPTVLLLFNCLKFLTEILFKKFGVPRSLIEFNKNVAVILNFTLNAQNVTSNTIPMIVMYNSYEIFLVLILLYVQKNYRIRILEEERRHIVTLYKKAEIFIRVSIYTGLFLESFFGNSFFILVIYFLLRQQMMASKMKVKVRNERIFNLLRYLILLMFFLRDIFVIVSRIIINYDFSPVLTAFLDEKFVRKTLFVFFCQCYMYFKVARKKLLKLEEFSQQPDDIVSVKDFNRSYFKKYMLLNVVHVFKIKTFSHEDNYTDLCIKVIREYFEKHPLIKRFTDELKKKKRSHNYMIVAELVNKILMIILSVLLKNFDVIFKCLSYVSVVYISARQYMFHTFELYDVSVVMWSFISFIMPEYNNKILKKFAINIIFPCFIIGIIATKFMKSLFQVNILKTVLRPNDENNISQDSVDKYYKDHLYAFIPLLVYTVFQTLRENKSMQKMVVFKVFDMAEVVGNKGTQIDILIVVIKLIINLVIKFSRYITLSIGIVCSLVTVNIPNTILLMWTLYFFWTTEHDRWLWKYYIYYNIFFMSVLYINQIIPGDLESFNFEFLSILGFSKQGSIYTTQFIFIFVTTYFASLYFRYMDNTIDYNEKNLENADRNTADIKKEETIGVSDQSNQLESGVESESEVEGSENQYKIKKEESKAENNQNESRNHSQKTIDLLATGANAENELKKNIFYESFMRVNSILRHFFVTYMVWVFHIVILACMSFEAGDIFSLLLFAIDSLVFVAHLWITWSGDDDPVARNKKMMRWWYPSFITVILLICFRYLSFYTRYLMVRKVYIVVLNSFNIFSGKSSNDIFAHNSSFSRLFLKIDNSNKIDQLYNQFYLELIYLASSSLTLLSLSLNPKEGEDKKDEVEMTEVDKGTLLTEPQQDTEANEGIHEDTQAKPALLKAPSLPMILPKLETNSDGSGSKNKKKNNRFGFTIFFIFFMLLRTSSFTLVVYVFQSNMDILAFLFISAELVYFNLLFWNLTSVLQVFQVENYIKFSINYFKRGFVDKIIDQDALAGSMVVSKNNYKKRSPKNDGEGLKEEDMDNYFGNDDDTSKNSEVQKNKTIVRDLEQNRFYLDQLLLKVEKEVTTISTYISFLKVVITTLKGYFLLTEFLVNFYSGKGDPQATIAQNRSVMGQNTMFMCLILTELLLVKHYIATVADKKAEEVNPFSLSKFVVMMIMKLEYYSAFSSFKVKENMNEMKISKEVVSNSEEGRGSDFFNLNQLPGLVELLDKSQPKTGSSKMFMRRKETFDDRMRSEKATYNSAEIWYIQKQAMMVEVKERLFRFLAADIVSSKELPMTFDESYEDYCFEDPSDKFDKQSMADEYELELSTELSSINFVLGQGTPKLLRFLFVHLNSHKLKYCSLLSGLFYFLRRLLLLPLLYVVAAQSNIMNLPLLLAGLVYSLRGLKSITSDLKIFVPLFTILFAGMFFGTLPSQVS